MAITEGVGIVSAGKEARAKAVAKSKQVTSDKKIAAEYKVDPIDRMLRDIDKNFDRIRSQENTGGVKETGRGMADTFDPSKDFQVKRKGGYFSPGGGAFDERNNVEVASSDLSSLRSDDTSESTFGKSFTDQASANLADASIYKQKEDNIYRDTKDPYTDFKKLFDKTEEKKTITPPKRESYFDQKDPASFDKSVEFFTRNQRGTFQERKDDFVRKNLDYGTDADGTPTATSTSVLNYGQPLKVSTEKIKSFLVKDAKEDQADKERQRYLSIKKSMQEDEAADYQKKLKSDLAYEKAERVAKYGYDPKDYLKSNVPPSTTINEETGLQEFPKYYQKYEKQNPLTDPTDASYLGDDVVPKSLRAGFVDKENKTELGTMPSMGISEAGREQAKLNRLEKVATEKKDPTTLEKVGNFLGNLTNAALGIQPAGASELTGVDKALSGATKKLHLGSSGHSIDGVYMPSIAEKYKREKTGIEKGLDKAGSILNKMLGISGVEGAENPLSRTVPSGSFNISQEGKDQAAINRGIKAAEATGIPTGVAAQGGVTTQAARDAGSKARQEAADKRAKNMADAQGIASRNPNVSIVGGKAVATNDSGKARAQAAAVNRKIQGKTVSQVKAENKKKMQDAAKKRNEAFKKSKAQKKKKSGGGFGKSTSTTKKSAPKKSAPKKKSSPSSQASNKRAQASKKRQAAKKKASTAKKSKKSTSKSSKSKSSTSKSSKTAGSKNKRGSGARGNRGRRSRR